MTEWRISGGFLQFVADRIIVQTIMDAALASSKWWNYSSIT
jgi:hypothetical protein